MTMPLNSPLHFDQQPSPCRSTALSPEAEHVRHLSLDTGGARFRWCQYEPRRGERALAKPLYDPLGRVRGLITPLQG